MFMLGVWKFDEGSGSLVVDDTGHGLNGDIQGATWVTDSNSGQALDFDGINHRVELPDDNPAWLPRDDFSVSAWIKTSTTGAGNTLVFDGDYGGSGLSSNRCGFALEIHQTNNAISFSTVMNNTQYRNFTSNDTFNDSTWFHVAGVRNGTSKYLYLNGELIQTITVGSGEIDYVGNYCNDEVNIGRNTRGGQSPSAYFEGQIDEVRVIARALSQAEIQDLMDPDEVYSQTEQTASTKYYFAGGRLAMRTNGTLNYLLSDHLGSTSVTADANGDFVSEMRYMPWGETRYMSGTVGTDYLYTGQRRDTYINLIQMGARWYDPALGRFLQPDTIVPNPNLPTDWDRFAYVRNNPVRFKDSSGHSAVDCTNPMIVGASHTHLDGSPGVYMIEVLQAFDPFYGTYVEDINEGRFFKGDTLDIINNIDEAAKLAYVYEGINLHEVAENTERNTLSSREVDNLLRSKGFDAAGIEAGRLLPNSAHKPYSIFLDMMGKRYNKNLQPTESNNYMQYESNYLSAQMEAHPEVLQRSMLKYQINLELYGGLQSTEDILSEILEKWPGGGVE